MCDLSKILNKRDMKLKRNRNWNKINGFQKVSIISNIKHFKKPLRCRLARQGPQGPGWWEDIHVKTYVYACLPPGLAMVMVVRIILRWGGLLATGVMVMSEPGCCQWPCLGPWSYSSKGLC